MDRTAESTAQNKHFIGVPGYYFWAWKERRGGEGDKYILFGFFYVSSWIFVFWVTFVAPTICILGDNMVDFGRRGGEGPVRRGIYFCY